MRWLPERVLLAVPAIVIGLLGVVWALSSPLSSSPDEPAHIFRAVSLFSGSGVKVQLHVEGQAFYGTVRVPEYFARALPSQQCVVDDVARAATCESTPIRHPGRITDINTSAAGHPPVYYLLVGWIGRLIPSSAGVLLMRVFSAVVCGALVYLGTVVLSRRSRTMYPAVVAMSAVSPVAAFLAGAVNPQSFEICLTFAFVALVWDLFSELVDDGTDGPGWLRCSVVLLASAALGLTRPLSVVFLIAAVIAALVVCRVPFRAFLRPKGLIALGASMIGAPLAVAFELWAGHSSVDLAPADVPRSFSAVQALLGLVGSLAVQAGGVVSSLEAGPSSLAVAGFLIAVLTAVLFAVLAGGRTATVVSLVVLAATIALPVVANIPNVIELNTVIWQGRYGLPMLVVALVVAGLAVAGLDRRWERRMRQRALTIVCWAMAVAHIGGYWFAMYRWSVGVGGPMWWPAEARWSPPLAWWLLGTCALAACIAYAVALPAAASRYGELRGVAATGCGPDRDR